MSGLNKDAFRHIGMRKWKSVLAVFVGFWVWQLVRVFVPGLEVHPIYIYIYGIIEIRETSEKTVNFGMLRIKATFAALGVGLPIIFLSAFLLSLTDIAWVRLLIEMTVILAGILLVLIIAEWIGCKSFCGLAAAIFVIFVVLHTDGEPLTYSLLRAAQTIIGVFIAWLINVKLLPYPGRKAQESKE